MTLTAPNLDDRRFQQLVDDAKRMIQQRCPEWTDHNVSDPGVTLVEAFATMVDQLMYRLNRVPERNYLRFLDLIGVRLFAPAAARADVTFWLSAAQPETITVRAGTEVATLRTEHDEAIGFSTVADLPIVSTTLQTVATGNITGSAVDRTVELQDGVGFDCFPEPPTPGSALYVGLSEAAPSCAILLRIDCEVQGIGVDPLDPPLRWEAWNGAEWVACEVDRDGTGGLNRAGDVVLHLPPGHVASVLAQQRAGWLRCALIEPDADQPFYSESPKLRAIEASTIGGTATAEHAEAVLFEEVGRSDGSAGQRFSLERSPVALSADPEVLRVSTDQGWQAWTLVDSFAASTATDQHFVLDRQTGQLLLGPAVRQPDGTLTSYGAVPPKGAVLRLDRYRIGGGGTGNVAAHALRVLKTSLPFVSEVDNRRPAIGGVDGEQVADAMQRGPLSLRTASRAVTAQDYELLAREATPELGRVHCVPGDESELNVVRLLVIPRLPGDPQAQTDFGALRPSDDVLRRLAEHLEPRRMLGARLLIEPPYYRAVTVVARLKAAADASTERIRPEALSALYRLLHPQVGGPREEGWPLGRAVQTGDIHACLQRVRGVESVEDVRLYLADPVLGTRSETPVERIDLARTELVFSFEHQVLVRR
ncbi:putative baseplate assembly protein [Kribbella sandramycini]|uniref:Putative baseplate assembly protein n=1 Tax=Kribbella sandramycini TaxID=60450 RepID=A0A7Y4L6P9_9ACTN|nr:putative baseplate assembly protein [Kribbella sandramycini]MBB6570114.1 putative phage baseplate assembly protein [Kribbella sandramycini]NOL45384.1 putative baseplate assembly protein [Kribbella sandramycini]